MRTILILLVAAAVSACSTPGLQNAGLNAADAAAPAPALRYEPLATRDFAPVAPGNWTERNRAVAPTGLTP